MELSLLWVVLQIYFASEVFGGEIHHFPITPGEVFRRDRLTKDEGEHKCLGDITTVNAGGQPVTTPATCNPNPNPQEMVGGNFDYNWNR